MFVSVIYLYIPDHYIVHTVLPLYTVYVNVTVFCSRAFTVLTNDAPSAPLPVLPAVSPATSMSFLERCRYSVQHAAVRTAARQPIRDTPAISSPFFSRSNNRRPAPRPPPLLWGHPVSVRYSPYLGTRIDRGLLAKVHRQRTIHIHEQRTDIHTYYVLFGMDPILYVCPRTALLSVVTDTTRLLASPRASPDPLQAISRTSPHELFGVLVL